MAKNMKYTLTLQADTFPEFGTGKPMRRVILSTGEQTYICEGRNIGAAFQEAHDVLSELISGACVTCGDDADRYTDTFRSCGLCEDCAEEAGVL